jgi:hypothetical protein
VARATLFSINPGLDVLHFECMHRAIDSICYGAVTSQAVDLLQLLHEQGAEAKRGVACGRRLRYGGALRRRQDCTDDGIDGHSQ